MVDSNQRLNSSRRGGGCWWVERINLGQLKWRNGPVTERRATSFRRNTTNTLPSTSSPYSPTSCHPLTPPRALHSPCRGLSIHTAITAREPPHADLCPAAAAARAHQPSPQ